MSETAKPTRKKAAVFASPKDVRKEAPDSEPETQGTEPPGPAAPPPNEGGQVPGGAGTQVGTPPGTQVGRTVDKHQENNEESKTESPLDFSLRAVLADDKDPEQDWVKSGWQAKKYRKAAVKALIKIKWRGYTEEQDIIDAALDAYIPGSISTEAREMARRGEL